MSSHEFSTYDLILQAGETREIHRAGRFFKVHTADGAFALSVDQGPFETFASGRWASPLAPFDRIAISNRSGAVLTMELTIAMGQVGDDTVSLSGGAAVSTTPTAAGTFANGSKTVLATGVAASIVAARTGRRAVWVRNTSASDPVYLGGSGVTDDAGASPGLRVDPDGQAVVETEAAVYAYQASGGAVTVSAGELY